MLLSCCVIVCFWYMICSLIVLASSLYVISWPVTPCLLFPHQFLRQQSGSALFWGKMTAAHLHRNSSPNSTSFFPSTVKRWSGRKRPGKVYKHSRNILNRRFRQKCILISHVFTIHVTVYSQYGHKGRYTG